MKLTIGVDIGGTNTDAVVINEQRTILACQKVITTDNVSKGFGQVLTCVLHKAGITGAAIKEVIVGTTHVTNALLERKNLLKVGVLRLASKSGLSLSSCSDWSADMREACLVGCQHVSGGWYCDGRPLGSLKKASLEEALEKLLHTGMQSLAIVGVYAPMKHDQEYEAQEIAQTLLGNDFPISLSCMIGGLGFLERENATILNAALKRTMHHGFSELEQEARKAGILSPVLLTQNNGTLLMIEEAFEYPVLTISSGPTNSFIGGSKLARLNNAIIADIGGTSTDVGIVLNGFARRSLDSSTIAGIKLNFTMPDVLSVALGGGSYIVCDNEVLTIGPESVGRNLKRHAQGFGGQQLTLTDVALKRGIVQLEGAEASSVKCSQDQADRVYDHISTILLDLKKKMSGIRKHLPMVLVGGGADLFRNTSLANEYLIPEYAHVANAYGAALAEVCGMVDSVVSLEQREEVLKDLKEEAIAQAIARGARSDSLRVVEQEIIPYSYMPNHLARVRIIVAGGKV